MAESQTADDELATSRINWELDGDLRPPQEIVAYAHDLEADAVHMKRYETGRVGVKFSGLPKAIFAREIPDGWQVATIFTGVNPSLVLQPADD
jgi:hypothetical protein